MNIPEKYRDRYDMLARSHPWMREMMDEQAPEGDAVKELREFIDGQFVSGKTAWTQGMAIADMVERDYVSRKYLDEVRSEADYREGLLHESIDDLKAERDEKVSLLETAFKRCKELEAERDEWKAKLDAETKARNACSRHAANMEAERDEWKAKAEQAQEIAYRWQRVVSDYADEIFDLEEEVGEWKAKAEARSAERAAAAERLRNRVEYQNFLPLILGIDERSREWQHIDAGEVSRRLIDLLTDTHMDAESDGNGTCPDANGTTSNDNREKPAKLYGKEVDQVILDELHDTREKLEADAEEFAKSWAYDDYVDEETLHEMYDECLSGVIELLDRQKAITEDDCTTRYAVSVWERDCEIDELRAENAEQKELLYDIGLENAEKRAAIAKLRAENDELRAASDGADVDRLQRENISLARDLGAAMRDRDELQSAYDKLTRIAADLCRACGFSMVDASGEVVG